ncbi:MAG TPA: glycosyltransferase [Acidimicrobiales bacterium]|nr:glycosyltransferase [Acidimicrobiales bacterium]
MIAASPDGRRRVLHYSHHSTGLGHLVRSLAVAGALAEQAEVLFCSGGRVPDAMVVPAGVRLVTLPPIGTGESGGLTSLDPQYTLEEAWERRRRELLGCFDAFDPDALLVELFPFGRRKFAGEFTALLERARQGRRRTIVSSVRDLLVDAHRDKQRHDDEAAARLDAYFDAVIVHGDPRFARLEETFRPTVAPTVPVYYSGFVAPSTPVVPTGSRPSQILVSTGGGLLGGRLLDAVVAAHESILGPMGATTRMITGPFMPAEAYGDLSTRADGVEGLTVERFVPDLASAIAESAVSVSLCGYNTSIDLLRAGVPAVVVPYDEDGETEQVSRARRLESLGLVTLLPAAELSPESLATAVLRAVVTRGRPAGLDLDGAATTAQLMSELMSPPVAFAS